MKSHHHLKLCICHKLSACGLIIVWRLYGKPMDMVTIVCKRWGQRPSAKISILDYWENNHGYTRSRSERLSPRAGTEGRSGARGVEPCDCVQIVHLCRWAITSRLTSRSSNSAPAGQTVFVQAKIGDTMYPTSVPDQPGIPRTAPTVADTSCTCSWKATLATATPSSESATSVAFGSRMLRVKRGPHTNVCMNKIRKAPWWMLIPRKFGYVEMISDQMQTSVTDWSILWMIVAARGSVVWQPKLDENISHSDDNPGIPSPHL